MMSFETFTWFTSNTLCSAESKPYKAFTSSQYKCPSSSNTLPSLMYPCAQAHTPVYTASGQGRARLHSETQCRWFVSVLLPRPSSIQLLPQQVIKQQPHLGRAESLHSCYYPYQAPEMSRKHPQTLDSTVTGTRGNLN